FRKNGRIETGSAVGNKMVDEFYDKVESGQLAVGPDGQLMESKASGKAEYVAVEAVLVPVPPILKAFKALRGAAPAAEAAAETAGTTALAKSGIEISKHAAERMAERGITESMVE